MSGELIWISTLKKAALRLRIGLQKARSNPSRKRSGLRSAKNRRRSVEEIDERLSSTIGTFFTTREIAAALKVDVRNPQRWIRKGELKASWIGGEYRVSAEDLKHFLEKRKGVLSNRGPAHGSSRQEKEHAKRKSKSIVSVFNYEDRNK
jgi:excisionase family DNA binding protein